MAEPHPWPHLYDKDEWLTQGLEELLQKTHEAPEELLAAAAKLRAEAAETKIRGIREANLAMADRFELAAAARADHSSAS